MLQAPYCRPKPSRPDLTTWCTSACNFYITTPLQGFSLRLDVAAYGGILIALPVLLFQLWRFVTPGLKANEKRYALPFTAATVTLFAVGALVAYLTFPHALRFLINVSGPHVQPDPLAQRLHPADPAADAGLRRDLRVPGAARVARAGGSPDPGELSKWRRWAIIGMVVFAAVVTPSSDPFSMLALAIPLLVFYEGSIIVGKMLRK